MNLGFDGLPMGLAASALFCAMFGTLCWMVVARGAMRAHERLAAAAARTIAPARTPLPRVTDGPVRNG